jgi:uncharacterized protein YbjT (DUF2867 family)
MSQICVLGASGFVGSRVVPSLIKQGHIVRCGSRRPEQQLSSHANQQWVEADVTKPETLATAFEGCDTLIYLVHQMRASGGDLIERERQSAENVTKCAQQAGLSHIVYLGGPTPQGNASKHLEARTITGEILRNSPIPATELKAGMIVGHGSESWLIVRDLVARLPYMVLPAWLKTKSAPIDIDDVIFALTFCATHEPKGSMSYQLPGPEILSGEQILTRVGAVLGWQPRVINFPYLTPRLSSHWIRLVTRADMRIATELVEGLTSDLLMSEPTLWDAIDFTSVTPFDTAVRKALAAEGPHELSPMYRLWEKSVRSLAPALNYRFST